MFEILDPKRIQRSEKRIEWRVSLQTHMRFRDLLEELVDLENVPPEPEVLNRMESLRDDIRALPGFPVGYDVERDLIVPVTSSVQR